MEFKIDAVPGEGKTSTSRAASARALGAYDADLDAIGKLISHIVAGVLAYFAK